ncbi:hypothetical protein [Mammaliicoccus lentus]|uniref:hypothetical protein n=1 Tax=Mammaliicoccus lentus TaxID=42858 RepID=UPI00339929B3
MGQVIDFENSLTKRNLKGKIIPLHAKMKDDVSNNNGGNGMSKYIKRNEFEQFKNHIDNKFDRVFDKMDENRKEIKDDIKHQTTITVSIVSLVITLVGVVVPIVLHFI